MITEADILSFSKSVLENKDLSETRNPVNEVGDCKYYDPDTGHHCFVGYWLHHVIGISNDTFASVETKTADFAIRHLVESGVFTEKMEDRAIKLLCDIQQQADNSLFESVEDGYVPPTWGEVVKSYVYPAEEV